MFKYVSKYIYYRRYSFLGIIVILLGIIVILLYNTFEALWEPGVDWQKTLR